jgi:hypothetical protein
MFLLRALNFLNSAKENAEASFSCLLRRSRRMERARKIRSYLAALTIIFSSTLAYAQGLYDNVKTAEGWAWAQIKRNGEADLNEKCGTPMLDPKNEKDARWHEDCRKLSAKFLQDLLTRSRWRDAIPQGGIGIIGAHIVGDLDLTDVTFNRILGISFSRVEGNIDLTRANTNNAIELNNSVINGRFSAEGMHSENQVGLHDMEFRDAVTLSDARIAGKLDMSGSHYAEPVSLVGAKVGSSLFLSNASFEKPVVAGAAEIGGSLVMILSSFPDADFSGSKICGQVGLNGSTFGGSLNFSLLQVGGNLSLGPLPQARTHLNNLSLTGAKVAANVFLDQAAVEGLLEATTLQVGGVLSIRSQDRNRPSIDMAILHSAKIDGDLLIEGAKFNKSFNLNGAKIGGKVDISGTSFGADVQADMLQVGGNFSLSGDEKSPTNFHTLQLNNVKIKGDLRIYGVAADGPIVATAAQIGGNLFMGASTQQLIQKQEAILNMPYTGTRAAAKFNNVILLGAGVHGHVFMNGSYQKIAAPALRVTGSMHMQEANFLDEVDLNMARVGENLDLKSAHFSGPLYLSGATIAGDLQLGGDDGSVVWDSQGSLHLRNAHIGNLMDAENAWPRQDQLHVQGFPFGHLGGISGDTGRQMRRRGGKFWDKWARLDPDYSPLTYSQLASVFINEGERDAADDIRYLGREREREIACGGNLSGSCVLQSALGIVAGYGIGTYTFRVVYWVLLFWLIGLAVLWWTVPSARNRGLIWCCCASLAQLLPVVPVNKELTDFFVDPERARLKGWQVFLFSALGVIGLALGSILIVAVSGLTHSA